MKTSKQLLMEKKSIKKMKESIKMIKYIDELHKEEGEKIKTTRLWLKMLKIKKDIWFF